MKIEKLKIKPKINDQPTAAALLKALKPGEAIRIKTAAEWRNMIALIHSVGKKLGVKFGTKQDGDDVLVFIKDEAK